MGSMIKKCPHNQNRVKSWIYIILKQPPVLNKLSTERANTPYAMPTDRYFSNVIESSTPYLILLQDTYSYEYSVEYLIQGLKRVNL